MSQRIEVELDDQGRLVLPSSIGRQLGLSPGAALVVEQVTDDASYLRVQPAQPKLVQRQGVLVVEAESVGDLDEFMRSERERRVADLLQRAGL